MSFFWKILLLGSLILNVIAIWALFHYVMYGGSPLGELKRKIVRSSKQINIKEPYVEENKKILKSIEHGEEDSLRVIFIGASITHNWDIKRYFPDIHPIKRVIGGYVPDLLLNYKSNVLDLKPRAVVIKFCSINVKPERPMYIMKDGLSMMVELARSNGIIPIVSTIIPAGKPNAHIGNFSVVDAINEYNNWVRKYARDSSLAFIDYAAAIQDDDGFLPRDCSVDPIHINDKGYDIISAAAKPVIYKTLGISKED